MAITRSMAANAGRTMTTRSMARYAQGANRSFKTTKPVIAKKRAAKRVATRRRPPRAAPPPPPPSFTSEESDDVQVQADDERVSVSDISTLTEFSEMIEIDEEEGQEVQGQEQQQEEAFAEMMRIDEEKEQEEQEQEQEEEVQKEEEQELQEVQEKHEEEDEVIPDADAPALAEALGASDSHGEKNDESNHEADDTNNHDGRESSPLPPGFSGNDEIEDENEHDGDDPSPSGPESLNSNPETNNQPDHTAEYPSPFEPGPLNSTLEILNQNNHNAEILPRNRPKNYLSNPWGPEEVEGWRVPDVIAGRTNFQRPATEPISVKNKDIVKICWEGEKMTTERVGHIDKLRTTLNAPWDAQAGEYTGQIFYSERLRSEAVVQTDDGVLWALPSVGVDRWPDMPPAYAAPIEDIMNFDVQWAGPQGGQGHTVASREIMQSPGGTRYDIYGDLVSPGVENIVQYDAISNARAEYEGKGREQSLPAMVGDFGLPSELPRASSA